jgi:VWFA-related protein
MTITIVIPSFAIREDLKLDVGIKSIDASHFPLIQLYATISDRDGAYIRNLDERYFLIAENRYPVESFIVKSTLKNMDVVLCLDSSASMKKSMKDLKRAAYSFVRGLDSMDRCAVIAFNNRVTTLQNFTNDKYLISNAIFQMRPAGGTLLYDGIFAAINKCALSNNEKAVIVITDGDDESYSGRTPFSRHTLEEVIVHARQVNVPLYILGIGDDIDKSTLSMLANESGGVYYYLPSPYELNRMIKMVFHRFKTFYNITYSSPCPIKDGTARVVELECNIQNKSGHSQVLYMTPGGNNGRYIPMKRLKRDRRTREYERPRFKHLRNRDYY